MSNRHLSTLLTVLLLCGLALGLGVMLRGPEAVERSLIGLFQAQQEVLAEQTALRIQDSLRDVRVRLSTAGEQLGSALTESKSAEPLSDTLAGLIHHTDKESGVTLAILNQRGKVLAIDPRTSAEQRAAIDLFTQDDPHFKVTTPPKGTPEGQPRVFVHRERLLSGGSRLLSTRLNDKLILAAIVNIGALATKNFNQVVASRKIRAVLRDKRDGKVVVAVDPDVATKGQWVTGTAQAPGSQFLVEISASRNTIVPEIRRQVRLVVYISLSLVVLLMGSMLILVLLNRRTHQQNLDRTRALLHQDKLATLGLMAVSTAHEIRNAITVASLQLQIAASTTTEEQTIGHLNKASQSVDRLTKLAENLSRYGQKTTAAQSHFDLCSAIDEALEIVQPRIHTRVALNLDLHPALYIYGSRNEIVQVLVNLVLNAVDATESNKGRAVTIRTRRDGEEVVVSIIDDGAGIARSARDKLFEPFFSTKSSDGTQSGTGVGLWLSSEIIARHRGSIRAENLDAGGAQFQVRLRLDERPA